MAGFFLFKEAAFPFGKGFFGFAQFPLLAFAFEAAAFLFQFIAFSRKERFTDFMKDIPSQ